MVENENKIFNWAQASLDFYKLTHSVTFHFQRAAYHLIGMLYLLLAVFFIPPATVVLIILLTIFSILLSFNLLVFNYEKRKGFKTFDHLQRKELIGLHFTTKQAIKKMESLKSSDFLFKTPIVGFLMRIYVSDLSLLETILKGKAYPNHVRPPKKLTIHEYDPLDPWQKDMSDLKRYQNLPMN